MVKPTVIHYGTFQLPAVEVHCPACHKLLLKISPNGGILETICPRCSVLVRWPVLAAEQAPRHGSQN